MTLDSNPTIDAFSVQCRYDILSFQIRSGSWILESRRNLLNCIIMHLFKVFRARVSSNSILKYGFNHKSLRYLKKEQDSPSAFMCVLPHSAGKFLLLSPKNMQDINLLQCPSSWKDIELSIFAFVLFSGDLNHEDLKNSLK